MTPQPSLFEKKFVNTSRSNSVLDDGSTLGTRDLILSSRNSSRSKRSIQSQQSQRSSQLIRSQLSSQGSKRSQSTKKFNDIPQRTYVTSGAVVPIQAGDKFQSPVSPQTHILKAFDETKNGNSFIALQRGTTFSAKNVLNHKLHQFKISSSLDRESPDKASELHRLYSKLTESLNDDSGGIKNVVPLRYRREKFKINQSNPEKLKVLKEESHKVLALNESYLMSPKQRRELLKQQMHQQQARLHIREQLTKETRLERYIKRMYKNGSNFDITEFQNGEFDHDTFANGVQSTLERSSNNAYASRIARENDLSTRRKSLLESKQHSAEGRLTFGKEIADKEQKIFDRKKKTEFSKNSEESPAYKDKEGNPYRRERLFTILNAGRGYNILTGEEISLK